MFWKLQVFGDFSSQSSVEFAEDVLKCLVDARAQRRIA